MRVLLADDHALFRGAMHKLIAAFGDVEIVAECTDGMDTVARFLALRPDVALIDIRMPTLDGLEATRQILADIPDARILIITLDTDGSALERARAAGALGFLSKQRAGSELEAAIRTVARGHKYPPGSA